MTIAAVLSDASMQSESMVETVGVAGDWEATGIQENSLSMITGLDQGRLRGSV